MNIFSQFSNWFNIHSGTIGVVFGFFTVILPFLSFLHIKRVEISQKQFKTYHSLIKQLVGGDEVGIYLDRKIAIIFELRRFKVYYPVTKRILTGLRDKWLLAAPNAPYDISRLIEEANLTLKHIG